MVDLGMDWCKCGHRKQWHREVEPNCMLCEVYGCDCIHFERDMPKPKEEKPQEEE